MTTKEFLKKHEVKIILFDCEHKKGFKTPFVKYVSIEKGKKEAIQLVYGSTEEVTEEGVLNLLKELIIEITSSDGYENWCKNLEIEPTDETFNEYCRLSLDIERTTYLLGALAIQDLLSMNDITEHPTGEMT